MNVYQASNLVTRYLILLVIGVLHILLQSSSIFYLVFTPLTVYPSYWILSILYDARLVTPTVIFFKGYYATIIPACVAGSAYYLLLILNLTTQMPIRKRIFNLIYIFLAFLILNIIRIVLFSNLMFKGYQYFDIAHIATWYFGSTILVVLIWFSSIILFKIKDIPIYTDLFNILKDTRR